MNGTRGIDREMIARFSPMMVYTMNRETLRALLLERPAPAFWNGRTYRIKSKHVGAGIYEVTGQFDRESPEALRLEEEH